MSEERIIDTETLDGLIAHLKHYMAPAPGHVCGGPDSMCDCSCEEFARDCELLHKAKRARAATVPQPSRERAEELRRETKMQLDASRGYADTQQAEPHHRRVLEIFDTLCAMASQAGASELPGLQRAYDMWKVTSVRGLFGERLKEKIEQSQAPAVVKQTEPLSRSDDHVRAHVDESLGYRASSQTPANPSETPDSSTLTPPPVEKTWSVGGEGGTIPMKIYRPDGSAIVVDALKSSIQEGALAAQRKAEYIPTEPDAAREEAKKCGLRITYCRSFQVAATQEQAEKMAKALRDNPDATKEELDVIMNEIMGVKLRKEKQ